MLQERVAARWPQLEGGVGSTLVLGGVSGVFTVYASMPFDNIKTRMQSVQSADARYAGMVDCAARILRSDGVFAFWRGTSPRLVRLTVSLFQWLGVMMVRGCLANMSMYSFRAA